MSILALDLSKRSTGWAAWQPGWNTARYGHWQLGSEYTSDGGTYCKLHEKLYELWQVARYEHLFLEDPISQAALSGHTNIATLRILSGLAAHAESFAEQMRLRTVMRVNVASWRRHFIGKMPRGTKSKTLKQYAMQRCRDYGFTPRNDDEADALGLLDHACHLQGLQPPWSAGEVLRPALMSGGRS